MRSKIVVLTGAGISAESGLKTFRDTNGLWENHPIEQVATPQGWHSNPKRVLDFYNQRRLDIKNAKPNTAHQALVELERQFEVVIITQNIDDLHERAGSSKVLHIHGEIIKARSTKKSDCIHTIGYQPIYWGDTAADGSQLRPHIVWFGEEVFDYSLALAHMQNAHKVLIIGTSLQVFPVASLSDEARFDAEKIVVAKELDTLPDGYTYIQGAAGQCVPKIVKRWLE